jgi:F-type H+-transporting ATPase subunit epsilon
MGYTLEIVTPDRVVFTETVDFLSVRGIEGELGITPGHIPLFTRVVPDLATIHLGDRREVVAVMDGFLDIQPGRVRILAEAAERAAEIDEVRARQAKERAEIQLSKVKAIEAEAALQRAVVRLRAIELIGGLRR